MGSPTSSRSDGPVAVRLMCGNPRCLGGAPAFGALPAEERRYPCSRGSCAYGPASTAAVAGARCCAQPKMPAPGRLASTARGGAKKTPAARTASRSAGPSRPPKLTPPSQSGWVSARSQPFERVLEADEVQPDGDRRAVGLEVLVALPVDAQGVGRARGLPVLVGPLHVRGPQRRVGDRRRLAEPLVAGVEHRARPRDGAALLRARASPSGPTATSGAPGHLVAADQQLLRTAVQGVPQRRGRRRAGGRRGRCRRPSTRPAASGALSGLTVMTPARSAPLRRLETPSWKPIQLRESSRPKPR